MIFVVLGHVERRRPLWKLTQVAVTPTAEAVNRTTLYREHNPY